MLSTEFSKALAGVLKYLFKYAKKEALKNYRVVTILKQEGLEEFAKLEDTYESIFIHSLVDYGSDRDSLRYVPLFNDPEFALKLKLHISSNKRDLKDLLLVLDDLLHTSRRPEIKALKGKGIEEAVQLHDLQPELEKFTSVWYDTAEIAGSPSVVTRFNKVIQHLGQIEEKVSELNAPPIGLIELSDYLVGLKREGFKEYLSSRKYVSRSDFNASLRDDSESVNEGWQELKTEGQWLEELLEDDYKNSCVIYGKGGIGKTRLMLELGLMTQKRGWIVFALNGDAFNSKVDDLLKYLNQFQNSHILILVDYLESLSISKDFARTLQTYLHAKGVTLKSIGNCRNTSYHEINDIPGLIEWDMDNEVGFKEFVIKRILLELHDSPDEGLIKFYELRPSFAVFFLHLIKKGSRDAVSRKDLINASDFRPFLIRRIKLTLGKERDVIKKASYLTVALSYPLEDVALKKLKNQYHKEIDLMERDGWLERTNDNLTIPHDTIADALLSFYLEHNCNKSNLEGELSDHFEFALKTDTIQGWNKIYAHISEAKVVRDCVEKRFFYSYFKRTLEDNPTSLEQIKARLILSRLVQEQDRWDLIFHFQNFFHNSILAIDFIKPLAFAIKELNNNGLGVDSNQVELIDHFSGYLKKWHGSQSSFYLGYPDYACKFISSYIWILGVDDFIKEEYRRFKSKNKFLPIEASFIFQRWIEKNGVEELIEKDIRKWLKAYQSEIEAQYVLRTWLENKPDYGWVNSHLRSYIEDTDSLMSSSAKERILEMIQATETKRSSIKDYVKNNLESNINSVDSLWLITNWLRASTDMRWLRQKLNETLKDLRNEKSLNKSIDLLTLSNRDLSWEENYIFRFVNLHYDKFQTGKLLSEWIKLTKEIDGIQKCLDRFFEKNIGMLQSRFLLEECLEHNSWERIPIHATNFIQTHWKTPECASVIKKWLLSPYADDAKIHAKRFLDNIPESDETEGIIRHWLCAEYDFEVIKDLAQKTIPDLIHWRNVMQRKEIINVKVIDKNKDGLIVELNEHESAFMRSDQVSSIKYKDHSRLIGKQIDAVVIGIDYLSKNQGNIPIYISAKKAYKVANEANSQKALISLNSGNAVTGIVSEIHRNRKIAFIHVFNHRGILRIENLTNKNLLHIDHVLEIGDKIDVMKEGVQNDSSLEFNHKNTFSDSGIFSNTYRYRPNQRFLNQVQNENITTQEVDIKINNWLRNGGNPDAVRVFLDELRKKSSDIFYSSPIYIFHMLSVYKLEEARNIIQCFIGSNNSRPFECYKVLVNWVVKGGAKNFARNMIDNYLRSDDNWHDYLSWVFSRENFIPRIKDQIMNWVNQGNDFWNIKDVVHNYLNEYGENLSSYELFEGWINTTRDKDSISSAAERFFKKNSKNALSGKLKKLYEYTAYK